MVCSKAWFIKFCRLLFDFYQRILILAHNAVVTAAIFAPCPWNVVQTEYNDNSTGMTGPEVIVTADWTGAIKIFLNK